MAVTLSVEILTPEAVLWRGAATALVARSSVGNFTVLAQHTATVGDLVSSVVRVDTDAGPLHFAVHSGYFQVAPGPEAGETTATIVAGVAERTSEIDVARAQAAKESAEAEIAAARGGDEKLNYDLAVEALARAELRLSAAAR